MHKNKIICLICSLLGGFAGLVGVVAILHGSASSNWPSVEGRILRAETSYGGSMQRTKSFRVSYSYSVNNKQHIGERIGFMFDRGTFSNVMPYSVGQDVLVYYDPSDSSNTVLLTGVQPYYLFVAGLGIVFIMLGWVVHRLSPHQKHNGR